MFRVKPRLKLAFMENDSARKETFRKRRKGLLKKIHEIAILCDVEACGVIYSPFAEEAEVWPSTAEVQRLVAELETVPAADVICRKFTQKTYLKERLAKVEHQLQKQTKQVAETEKSNAMQRHVGAIISQNHATLDELDDLSSTQLNDLVSLVDKNLRDIDNHKRWNNIALRQPETPPNNVGVAGEPNDVESGTGSSGQEIDRFESGNDDPGLDFWLDHSFSLADLFSL